MLARPAARGGQMWRSVARPDGRKTRLREITSVNSTSRRRESASRTEPLSNLTTRSKFVRETQPERSQRTSFVHSSLLREGEVFGETDATSYLHRRYVPVGLTHYGSSEREAENRPKSQELRSCLGSPPSPQERERERERGLYPWDPWNTVPASLRHGVPRESSLDIPCEIHAKSTRGPRELVAVVARRFAPALTAGLTVIVDDPRNPNDASHGASVSIFVCVAKTRRDRPIDRARFTRLVTRWYLHHDVRRSSATSENLGR